MSDALYVSASGALARMLELETVANNLANADTIGFKRDRTLFDAVMQSTLSNEGGDPVAGAAARVFVDSRSSGTEHRNGPIQPTGNPLDVAIDGPGFFAVDAPDGERFTRAGAFLVSDDGTLSTSDGFPVQTESGPVSVGTDPIEINGFGEVIDSSGAVLGRLRLAVFEDPEVLVKQGSNLFAAPDGVEAQSRVDSRFVARSLERSNVTPVRELAALVSLQRLFDVTLQAIRTEDQTTRRLIQEVTG